MFFNVIVPALSEWMPVAVIAFAVVLILFAELSRWLRDRQAPSPRMVWIEIIVLAVTLAVLVTVIDWLIKR